MTADTTVTMAGVRRTRGCDDSFPPLISLVLSTKTYDTAIHRRTIACVCAYSIVLYQTKCKLASFKYVFIV